MFKSKKVVGFLDRFDNVCRGSMESAFTEFKNHSEPIISVPDIKVFIKEAPAIFGDVYKLLCDTRSVRKNQKAEQGRNLDREHSVFFDMMCLARQVNRKKLKHWAMIQNVTNFARGVGRSAEKAISYFGNLVSSTTRLSVFGNLTGNLKMGRATNNTLKHKQTRALRVQNALILCYDNYQKGLQLQHQRGTHSSSFFRGTHQCAHTVFPFENHTFDEFHALFTQHEQAIPSSWGMPVYEIIDFDSTKSICNFIVNYENYKSITTPDFT